MQEPSLKRPQPMSMPKMPCHDVFLCTQNITDAIQEIERKGGRVLQRFSDSALIARFSKSLKKNTLAHCRWPEKEGMDPKTRMLFTAWNSIIHKGTPSHAPVPHENTAWDHPDLQSPKALDAAFSSGSPFQELPAHAKSKEDEEGEEEDENASSASRTARMLEEIHTDRYLIGPVTAGIVIISRDRGIEKLNDSDQVLIMREVQKGLHFLSTYEPRARVSFVCDYRPVTVSARPGPYSSTSDTYEDFESGWRDAALVEMGYQGGPDGYREYVKTLQEENGTEWAFVAFFTKYPLNHFAYAGGEKIVLHIENDSWGAENIHRVFSHEVCHVFGAADEYGDCNPRSRHGYLRVPNMNCRNRFIPGSQESQEECLMDRNVLKLCKYTRWQIGWKPKFIKEILGRQG